MTSRMVSFLESRISAQSDKTRVWWCMRPRQDPASMTTSAGFVSLSFSLYHSFFPSSCASKLGYISLLHFPHLLQSTKRSWTVCQPRRFVWRVVWAVFRPPPEWRASFPPESCPDKYVKSYLRDCYRIFGHYADCTKLTDWMTTLLTDWITTYKAI